MTTTQDIIRNALILASIIDDDEAIDGDVNAIALSALNSLVFGWQNEHAVSWRQEELTIPLTGAQSYKIGPNGNVSYGGEDYTVSTLAPVGQVFLEFADTTGMSDGDAYSVGANSGVITQVYDSTRIIISALIEEVQAGDICKVGEKKSPKPLDVYSPIVDQTGSEISINMISRYEYRSTPNKDSIGMPVQVFFERKLDDGIVYVWPVGTSGVLKVMADLPFDEILMSDVTKQMPFPENWKMALEFNLAIPLASYFKSNLRDDVIGQAGVTFETVKAIDSPLDDIVFAHGGEYAYTY